MTSGLFSILGVQPLHSQTFSSADAADAVLSFREWQLQFGERADALGSVIWIEGRPFTVVGIMPERFWFPDMGSPVWIPLSVDSLASRPP